VAAVTSDARTILVVDDDADVLVICQHLFTAAGYGVVCVTGATVSGLAAARAIRKEPGGQSMPIIAVSALGETVAADALAAGCTEYYVKPIDPRSLLRVVERLVGSARTTTERGHA
jgi:CheY-like chemotaxis protein